jgi:flagellar basal-body rod protein FlgF
LPAATNAAGFAGHIARRRPVQTGENPRESAHIIEFKRKRLLARPLHYGLRDFGSRQLRTVREMETPSIMALARQMSIQKEMDAIANNVANANTTAYKADRVTFNSYVAQPRGTSAMNAMIFPKMASPYREMTDGTISATGNPLDVAIRGEGYMVVDTPQGQRFTRDGHLSIDVSGRLVSAGGQPILDDGSRPITIPQGAGSITISDDGSISAGEQRIGKIRLVSFDDPQALKRVGAGLYTAENAPPRTAPDAELIQYGLEGANIEPVLEMTRMMEVSRAYQGAQKIVETEDDRMRRGIEMLGKVA